MNKNFTSSHPGTASQASIIGFRGNTSRRIGGMRSVILESKITNTDHIFGAVRTFQGSFEETFGKTANDIDLEADEEMFDPNDKVLSVYAD